MGVFSSNFMIWAQTISSLLELDNSWKRRSPGSEILRMSRGMETLDHEVEERGDVGAFLSSPMSF